MPRQVRKLQGGGEASGASIEEMVTKYPEMFQDLNPEDLKPATAGPPAGEASTGLEGMDFAPPGGRPPAGARTVNYQDREGFENNVFDILGANPFDIDPYEMVEQANAKLPEIFNQVFQGQVIWSDRNKLDKDQTKFWNAVQKQFHAHIFARASGARKMMTEKYNWMMNKFDNDKKSKDANLKRMQEGTKAPETRNLINAEGDLTMHQWNKKTAEWDDTGKGTKAPKEAGKLPQVVTKAIELVTKNAKAISPELAMMVGLNPELPKQQWFQNMMSEQASPEMRALLDRQWDIINSFYGLNEEGAATIGREDIASKVASGLPEPVMTPSHGPGTKKAKKGTTGKAKRIKMDKQGNIIQ
jgi:hypothetical protein